MGLRKRTRETLRHERATVLQQLGAQADADPRAFWEANKTRAAELRRGAQRGGESDAQGLGLVTGKPLTAARGKGTADSPEAPCAYCGEAGGHHTGQCPVVS